MERVERWKGLCDLSYSEWRKSHTPVPLNTVGERCDIEPINAKVGNEIVDTGWPRPHVT